MTAKARASGQLRKQANTPPLIDFGGSSSTTQTAPKQKKEAKKEWDDDAWNILNS
jgi:hypothetical protein